MITERALLEVQDLVQVFGSGPSAVRAVDGVSIQVERGETLGLVGESGCGKTTLARCILLMQQPTSGHIQFGGVDLLRLRGAALRRHRQRVQLVFQDPNDSLDPRFTVIQSVREPLQAAGIKRQEQIERAKEALDQVGLQADALERFPHEFSGGQRQRIAIARAIVVRPELLVLDEPTSALDVSVQAQVLNLLLRLQQELAMTYLFISHNLSVVHHLAHRIAVMNAGRIVEVGAGDQIMKDPQEPYTKSLLDSMPALYRA